MRTIQVDEAKKLNIEATKDTDFHLLLTFPQTFTGGTLDMELSKGADTIKWTGALSGLQATFQAKAAAMTFPTGVYTYVISYKNGDSTINLVTGYFIFKPRF